MRDLFKLLLVGIVMIIAPLTYANEQYKVIVLPDNIVTENETVDSYIYNATAEFFANEVINILNQTDFINSPTISEERKVLKSNPAYMIPARNLTNKFKTSYNVDFLQLKKITTQANSKYALLITSTIDAENYVLRRTVWDFLNIPGATVIDPAYKISTYAVLVDTDKNSVLWSNTFYKTISVCENRIITRGPSPQTEQLQKIRDYSRMLCPEIAQNVQINVLPSEVFEKESKQVYYDLANFDNTFTKKYRRWKKEGAKDYKATKSKVDASIDVAKEKINETKDNAKAKYEQIKKERQEKAVQKQLEKLEVKAEPVEKQLEKSSSENIFKPAKQDSNIHNINYKMELEDQTLYEPIEIKKRRTNNLYGEYDPSKPPLRDYD